GRDGFLDLHSTERISGNLRVRRGLPAVQACPRRVLAFAVQYPEEMHAVTACEHRIAGDAKYHRVFEHGKDIIEDSATGQCCGVLSHRRGDPADDLVTRRGELWIVPELHHRVGI